MKKHNQELEFELSRYKELAVEREVELKESRMKYQEALEQIEFLKNEIKSSRQAFTSIEESNQDFRSEIQSYTNSIVDWQKELQELQKSYHMLVNDNISALKKM